MKGRAKTVAAKDLEFYKDTKKLINIRERHYMKGFVELVERLLKRISNNKTRDVEKTDEITSESDKISEDKDGDEL